MEQQLAAINWPSGDSAETRESIVGDLERQCQEQASTIKALQRKLEDQEKEYVSSFCIGYM